MAAALSPEGRAQFTCHWHALSQRGSIESWLSHDVYSQKQNGARMKTATTATSLTCLSLLPIAGDWHFDKILSELCISTVFVNVTNHVEWFGLLKISRAVRPATMGCHRNLPTAYNQTFQWADITMICQSGLQPLEYQVFDIADNDQTFTTNITKSNTMHMYNIKPGRQLLNVELVILYTDQRCTGCARMP